ncbi:MAG: hypothetical protein HQ517_14035 [SAR324 cluster bacterium]|nr:hypothetical protein [SAR324 cluster bacterium]
MDIRRRLFRLMRTIAEDKFTTIGRFVEESSGFLDEKLRSWEAEFEINQSDTETGKHWQDQRTYHESIKPKYGEQFVEDLQLFGLAPPSSMEEVRQVRNREMKKFHPDKYLNQPEKMETAKQIVQIYNAAYDRLKGNFKTSR